MEKTGVKIVAKNSKAFHEYFVEERFEAGIELFGTCLLYTSFERNAVAERAVRQNADVLQVDRLEVGVAVLVVVGVAVGDRPAQMCIRDRGYRRRTSRTPERRRRTQILRHRPR